MKPTHNSDQENTGGDFTSIGVSYEQYQAPNLEDYDEIDESRFVIGRLLSNIGVPAIGFSAIEGTEIEGWVDNDDELEEGMEKQFNFSIVNSTTGMDYIVSVALDLVEFI